MIPLNWLELFIISYWKAGRLLSSYEAVSVPPDRQGDSRVISKWERLLVEEEFSTEKLVSLSL